MPANSGWMSRVSDSAPPPYGDQPPHSYGQQPPGPPPYGYGQPAYAPRDHPQATTVLILGILGLVLCQIIAPFAWVMGNRVVREIDASGGQVGGRGLANAGRICGIVGTVLIAISVVVLLLAIVLAVGASTGP